MKNDSIRPTAIKLLLIGVVMVAGQIPQVWAGAPAVFAASSAAQPPAQPDEFVPVTDLAQQEQLPAAPLVIVAYAVAWIAVLFYVWFIWRRLAKVEHEIAALSRRIETKAQR